ncbi:HhH-GDP family DNA glycosylase [Methylobacterium sp. CM6247]
MPAFTAYIDRDTNRKVTVVAATAAHARQYATSRYGKVVKLKAAPNMEPPPFTEADASRLRDLQSGIGLRKQKIRRLRALGLIDEVHGLTPAGRSALSTTTKGEGDE